MGGNRLWNCSKTGFEHYHSLTARSFISLQIDCKLINNLAAEEEK
jgi:hypothetical protein